MTGAIHTDEMSVRVEHGDCRLIVPTLGVTVDAIVTDPPYHLIPPLKRFGAANSAPAQHGRDGAMARLSGGFMGQSWDGGNIAFDPETWRILGSALRPGGFLLAFGGTRTYHRMTCAIEDAGFVIQDCIMWLFGSGLPKRKDMLKPAYEPIVLAYKPGGAWTLQVDECRIGGGPSPSAARRATGKAPSSCKPGEYGDGHAIQNRIRPEKWLEPVPGEQLGRWPANIATDGSDEVLAEFPDSAGQQGDVRGTEPSDRLGGNGIYGHASSSRPPARRRSDGASAARFFYSSKAGSEDRWGSRHPTVKPVELMKWLLPLVTPPGGLVLDPFAGSGTTGVAALATGRKAILIEQSADYIADINARLTHYAGEGAHSLTARARNRPSAPVGGLFGDLETVIPEAAE